MERPMAIDKPAIAREGKQRGAGHKIRIRTSTNDDDV
jgi:hypothetical protein